MLRIKHILIVLSLVSILIFYDNEILIAQEPTVQIKFDTNNVTIGDPINLLLQFSSQKPQKVIFPFLQDSIGGLEIVKKFNIDTIKEKDKFILQQRLIITAFDSGTFVIPPLTFMLEKKETNDLYPITTDSISLHFKTLEVDTTKPIKDIKAPLDEPFTLDELLPYIIAILGIIGLAFVAFIIWKKYKSREVIKELDYDPKIPPDVTALLALEELEKAKLWQTGKIKLYHSRLTEILRLYIYRVFNIKALEMTSSEILENLKNILQESQFSMLEEILERADLVKFAKFEPLADENAQSLIKAIEFVKETYKIFSSKEENKED